MDTINEKILEAYEGILFESATKKYIKKWEDFLTFSVAQLDDEFQSKVDKGKIESNGTEAKKLSKMYKEIDKDAFSLKVKVQKMAEALAKI